MVKLIDGLKNAVFDNPISYIYVQRMFGAHRHRKKCVDLLKPLENERVLDIGCGPAYVLDFMPKVEYVGYDTNEAQIRYARKKYGPNCEFYAEAFTSCCAKKHKPFDAVLLLGLLHHLSDVEALGLLDVLFDVLKPNGRIVSLDPCFTNDQSTISRFIGKNDRGNFVRYKEQYINLIGNRFGKVDAQVHHNVGRLPSTELFMLLEARKEKIKD